MFLFLIVAAKLKNVIAAERIMRGYDDANGAVDARELLDGNDVLDVTEARAAVLLGQNHAEKAHFREVGDDVPRELGGFVPFHDVRNDLALGQLASATPKQLFYLAAR